MLHRIDSTLTAATMGSLFVTVSFLSISISPILQSKKSILRIRACARDPRKVKALPIVLRFPTAHLRQAKIPRLEERLKRHYELYLEPDSLPPPSQER